MAGGPASSSSEHRSGDGGASAVEFALIVPILLALVFGIIIFGSQISLNTTARDAARSGVVSPLAPAAPLTCQQILDLVQSSTTKLWLVGPRIVVTITARRGRRAPSRARARPTRERPRAIAANDDDGAVAILVAILSVVANGILADAKQDNPDGSRLYRHEIISVGKTWSSGQPCGGAAGNWSWLHCGSGANGLGNGIATGQCPDTLQFTGSPPTTAIAVTKPGQNTGQINAAMTTLPPLDNVVPTDSPTDHQMQVQYVGYTRSPISAPPAASARPAISGCAALSWCGDESAARTLVGIGDGVRPPRAAPTPRRTCPRSGRRSGRPRHPTHHVARPESPTCPWQANTPATTSASRVAVRRSSPAGCMTWLSTVRTSMSMTVARVAALAPTA